MITRDEAKEAATRLCDNDLVNGDTIPVKNKRGHYSRKLVNYFNQEPENPDAVVNDEDEPDYREHLVISCHRMIELIGLNAPEVMLIAELELINVRALRVIRNEVFATARHRRKRLTEKEVKVSTKEETYDERISPLMKQIIAICKEHKIVTLASFSLDLEAGLTCDTVLLEDDFDPPEKFRQCCSILRSQRSPVVTVTTEHGDGSKTIEALLP